jgi:ferredoxin
MEVLVQPLNRVIRVEPGANLLQALQAAQVPMSYSCMAGRCGTCRCRVIDGEVLAGRGEQQRPLDADASCVLACQTYLTEPCTIEIPEPDEIVVHPARIVKAPVVAIEDLTHDIKLRRKHEGPMLCVAGGTGLAPILAILRGAVAAGMRNPIHLYFGVRSPRDVYGLAWLEQLQGEHPALTVHVVVASGGDPAAHRCGLVTQAIEADLGDLHGWRAYLCGSPPMVETATRVARQKGIAADHVHADAFYPQGA